MLLDLVLITVEFIVKVVKNGGNLGYSDHALVEFVISRNKGLANSGIRTLHFRN